MAPQAFAQIAPTVPYSGYLITAFFVVILLYNGIKRNPYADLPLINPKRPTELTTAERGGEFMSKSEEIIREGWQKFKEKPYRCITEHGEWLIIPPKYVAEVKNDARLSFSAGAGDDHHCYLPGFEPFQPPPGFSKIISSNLNIKTLSTFTQPISEEASTALRDVFTDSTEWKCIDSRSIMQVISRMASRVFMGPELCNDQDWIKKSSEYTFYIFGFNEVMSWWPRWARPYVYWLHPGSRRLRQHKKECREVLRPHIERRKAVIDQTLARGEKQPYDDAIEWFRKGLGDSSEPAVSQIQLSLVANHTTSDLLTQVMIDLAKNPQYIEPLREEAIRVLSSDGLKQTAFQKLTFMDSCLKESQRIRPTMTVFFQRKALKDVTLSDGFVIKKGTRVGTPASCMTDPTYYPDPFRFDPNRWMDMRNNPEDERKAQLVAVSPDHMGFGLGIGACPGRFFAANELKIALSHIVLKYDWKLAEGSEKFGRVPTGTFLRYDPRTKFIVRRRKDELDLDNLEC